MRKRKHYCFFPGCNRVTWRPDATIFIYEVKLCHFHYLRFRELFRIEKVIKRHFTSIPYWLIDWIHFFGTEFLTRLQFVKQFQIHDQYYYRIIKFMDRLHISYQKNKKGVSIKDNLEIVEMKLRRYNGNKPKRNKSI